MSLASETWRPAAIGMVAAAAVVQFVTALLMVAAGWDYPPVPMFAAAVVAGLAFRGRPGMAAHAGAAAGMAGGFFTEWLLFLSRLDQTAGLWAGLDMGSRLAFTVAEGLAYAGMLAFFAAFVSWVSAPSDSAPPPPTPASATRGRKGVRFQPDEDSHGPDLPLLHDQDENA